MFLQVDFIIFFFCRGGKVAYLEGVISTWKGRVWAACSSQSGPCLHPAQLPRLGE